MPGICIWGLAYTAYEFSRVSAKVVLPSKEAAIVQEHPYVEVVDLVLIVC